VYRHLISNARKLFGIKKGIILMFKVALDTNKLREELESLISLKGLNHKEVLKLSERLDKYILMHYLKKELIDDSINP
jgi:hypothetical protein